MDPFQVAQVSLMLDMPTYTCGQVINGLDSRTLGLIHCLNPCNDTSLDPFSQLPTQFHRTSSNRGHARCLGTFKLLFNHLDSK